MGKYKVSIFDLDESSGPYPYSAARWAGAAVRTCHKPAGGAQNLTVTIVNGQLWAEYEPVG